MRANRLLPALTTKAPRNAPSCSPTEAPANFDTRYAAAHATTMLPMSRRCALSKTANATGAISNAIHSLHDGSAARDSAPCNDGSASCNIGPSAPPVCAPSARPKPSPRKTTMAPLKRAVPEERCRVESSVSATVNVRPGNKITSPASDVAKPLRVPITPSMVNATAVTTKATSGSVT